MALPPSLDWVNEVSMMMRFTEPLGALQSEHIGLFWHRVRGEYPKVEQSLPHPESLSPSRMLSLMSRGLLPMPRFCFSSVDGSSKLVVQQDHLLISWDRDPDGPIDFDGSFVSVFEKATGFFEDFVREELNVPGMSTDLCELTFSGEFEFPDGSSGVDSGLGVGLGLLGALRAPDIGVPFGNPDFDFTYYYYLDSGLFIQVVGEVEFDEGNSPQYDFTLDFKGSQRLSQAGRPEVKAWLNSAYQSILNCYLSLSA